jgi:uncharacterized protein (DUF924 family)
VLEQARRGELDHWAQTARGRLALIVVLDQFSRNVYRGSSLSYSQDPKALELAVGGIEAGIDRELSSMERIFFWMPLGHSEVPALQERSVHHQEEEAANAPPKGDGPVRDLSGQGSTRRDSALRSPSAPQRDTGAHLHA